MCNKFIKIIQLCIYRWWCVCILYIIYIYMSCMYICMYIQYLTEVSTLFFFSFFFFIISFQVTTLKKWHLLQCRVVMYSLYNSVHWLSPQNNQHTVLMSKLLATKWDAPQMLIGFRSGYMLGHSITFSSKAVVILAVCLGWLCWEIVSEARASSSASECHSTCWNPCFPQWTTAPQYQQ